MAKPKLIFAQGDSCTLDWPVEIKWPESTRPTGRGTVQGKFATCQCFVTFQLLPETETQALMDELNEHNRRIADAQAKRNAAGDDEERAEADSAAKDAEEAFKSWRLELLRSVVVGFPEKHGFDRFFKELPDFSALSAGEIADYVEAFADLRPIGKALEDAYWKMANGGKVGN